MKREIYKVQDRAYPNIVKQESMTDKLYIENSRLMELIDEIVTQIVEKTFLSETYGYSHEVGREADVMFTEKAQDFYNEKYDEYEGLFNNIANIYSDNER
tara:strand:- start:148 stop:447 length:300 start_codon:yes stop_codon:yes gene_type:complete